MHLRRVIAAIFLTAFLSPFKTNAQPDRRITLNGNRHPLARAEFSVGTAAPELRLERMILVLRSAATKELELEALLAAQQDAASPLYHQWLTPDNFAERFGATQHDIGRVVSWLGSQGFSIDELPAGGRSIIFSGTAAQVQAAFHTEMRRYRVRGEMHLANASDPEVPEGLANVVAGVVSLHDFRRRAMHSNLHAVPQYSAGGANYYLAPADFATIYDVGSLYANGINGTGQSIAIVARCNIPMSDVQTFRQSFGLPVNNPHIIVNGSDPGIVSADELGEADLDVQWSGAVAPKATINFVVSGSTYSTDGVDLSAQYIVSHNLSPVMSTSFGLCEAWMGSTERAFYNSLWQQAAAQGITTLISSGDSGAAGCDSGSETAAIGGAAVNGLCSTPYSVCVGGTEFNEGSNPGQYWSTSNGSNWASALGYIPEKVWNESGSSGGYGLWAGGGGASAYYAKPAWQNVPGVPADGKRDVPDVSLTSAGHDSYLMYYQGSLVGIAGTSAASPAFAGLMALVNQQTGSRQGNANLSLYALAALQGNGGLPYFHDTKTGNNSVPGVAGFNAVPGYDRATGLGSVDAAVLVNHWDDAASERGISLNVTPATLTVASGNQGTVNVQIEATGGFNASVALSATGLPAGVTAQFAPASMSAPGSGSSTLTITAASGAVAGVYTVGIAATGGGITKSSIVSLTVSAAAGCTLAAAPSSFTVTRSGSGFTQISCGAVTGGFATPLTLSVTGAPQGVTTSFSAPTVTPGTGQSKLTVNAASNAPTGTYSLTVSSNGGGLSLSTAVSVTIAPPPTFTISAAPTSIAVRQGGSGQITISTAHVGTFSSAIVLSATGMPGGVTASYSLGTIAAPGDGTSKLTIQAGTAAAPGTYTLTLKAVGGSVTQTVPLTVTVQAPPGFTLALAQKTIAVGQGATASEAITISGLTGGFNSPVVLSIAQQGAASLPKGLRASLTPATIASPGSGTSILSFAPDSTVKPATYSLTVTAKGGNVTHAAALSLTVTPPPGFSLHATATTLSVLVGGTGSTAIKSTPVYGFTSMVALSARPLPPGVIVTFSPSSISGNGGSSTIKVQATSVALPGTYTINVNGTGGGATSSAAITLKLGRPTPTIH